MKLTTIPFSGFYNSIHSDEVNQAEQNMFTDRDTGCHRNEGLEMALWRSCNYRKVFEAYAKSYAENFGRAIGIKSMVFDELSSPKEYNFTTDRIFVQISEEDLAWLYDTCDKVKLAARAKERFTSRDGFISFYNPDITEWVPFEFWDANQIGTLMEVVADDTLGSSDGFEQWEELECVDREAVEGWISDATPNIQRLYKIHDYLETRAHRETLEAA